MKITMDQVFLNGRIYTMKSEGDTVEAVAVMNGKIVWTGSTEEAKTIDAKEVIDLQGKCVIPAFEDTHMHITHTRDRFKQIDLSGCTSLAEINEVLKAKDKVLKPGEWIVGYRIHIEKLADGRFPTKVDLDKVSTERPIYVSSYCGHAAMANSKCLEITGIKKGFVPPEGAFIDVDENGEPTGILREHISAYIMKFVGPLYQTYEDELDGLMQVLNKYASYGYTTIQSNEMQPDGEDTVRQLTTLKNEGKLPVRVILDYTNFSPNYLGIISGFGDDMLKAGSHKFFVDGSMNSHTAAMIEPYDNEPKTTGQLIYPTDQEFIDAVKKAYDYGDSIAAHTIGDYAMDLMIRAIKNCYIPGDPRRFRIIHAMLVNEEQLEELQKLPVILDTQPNFLLNWVNSCKQNIGEERAKLFLPYKTYLEKGLRVTGGSDSPVEMFNPFVGIQCAVTRQDMSGSPEEIFEPQERISTYEAVCLYTKYAAYSCNEEDIKGTVEPGKVADFAVLNTDIFKAEPSTIKDITVARTILGGRTVYEA
ncbi:MAG: amidohydrolase [Lachnospira sp.]